MSKKKNETEINKPLDKKFGVYDASAVFIGAYIVMLLLQFLFYVVLTITDVPVGGEEGFDQTPAYACITLAINEAAFLAAPFLYSKIRGRKMWTECGFSGKVSPLYLLLSALIGLSALFAFSPVATLVNSGFSALGFSSSTVPSAENAGTFIAYVFMSAIIPALCEEFLFRGHVARGFAGKGYLSGLLLSSLLFAVTHGSPVQLVYQFFVGAVACWLYFVTRSLWTSVIAHFISNFAVLVTDFALTSAGVDYITISGKIAGIFVAATIGGIALLVGLCYLLYRLVSRARGLEEELKGIKGASPKAWDRRLTLLAQSDEMRVKRIQEEQFRRAQIENAATPEIKEMLIQRFESEDKKDDKKDNKGLILCFAITGIIFILNTVLGFVPQ